MDRFYLQCANCLDQILRKYSNAIGQPIFATACPTAAAAVAVAAVAVAVVAVAVAVAVAAAVPWAMAMAMACP